MISRVRTFVVNLCELKLCGKLVLEDALRHRMTNRKLESYSEIKML